MFIISVKKKKKHDHNYINVKKKIFLLIKTDIENKTIFSPIQSTINLKKKKRRRKDGSNCWIVLR